MGGGGGGGQLNPALRGLLLAPGLALTPKMRHSRADYVLRVPLQSWNDASSV